MLRSFLKYTLVLFMFSGMPFTVAFAEDDTRLDPTEVLYLSLKAMAENPGAGRLETVSRFFQRIKTEELSADQEFARAEVSFVNLRPGEALYQFESFMDGSGLRSRIAWQKSMQIHFRAYQKHDLVEQLVEDYWQKFTPDPADIWHADLQITNLANKYMREGNHAKVVAIIVKEIERLPRNAPYRSFRLPVLFMGSFVAEGKREQAVQLIRDIRADMQRQLNALSADHPGGIRLFQPVDPRPNTYYRMEEGLEGTALEPGYPSLSLRVRQYMRLISELRLYR